VRHDAHGSRLTRFAPRPARGGTTALRCACSPTAADCSHRDSQEQPSPMGSAGLGFMGGHERAVLLALGGWPALYPCFAGATLLGPKGPRAARSREAPSSGHLMMNGRAKYVEHASNGLR
jgi:hypothetical protein